MQDRTEPPAVGKTASVRVDEPLHADLAALMRTGMTASDAVRRAVEIVATIYRGAWESGACPDGAEPVIHSANLTPYDTAPALYDTASDTTNPDTVRPAQPRHTRLEGNGCPDSPDSRPDSRTQAPTGPRMTPSGDVSHARTTAGAVTA